MIRKLGLGERLLLKSADDSKVPADLGTTELQYTYLRMGKLKPRKENDSARVTK